MIHFDQLACMILCNHTPYPIMCKYTQWCVTIQLIRKWRRSAAIIRSECPSTIIVNQIRSHVQVRCYDSHGEIKRFATHRTIIKHYICVSPFVEMNLIANYFVCALCMLCELFRRRWIWCNYLIIWESKRSFSSMRFSVF